MVLVGEASNVENILGCKVALASHDMLGASLRLHLKSEKLCFEMVGGGSI